MNCKIFLQTQVELVTGSALKDFTHVARLTLKICKKKKCKPIWHNILFPVISGTIAELITFLAYIPLDVIQQRHVLLNFPQLSQSTVLTTTTTTTATTSAIAATSSARTAKKSSSVWNTISTIYREHNRKFIKSFYIGTWATFVQVMPTTGLRWAIYELSKDMLDATTFTGYSMSGALSGFTVAVLVNPIDIARTRIQTKQGHYGQTSVWKLLRQIAKHEGFWKGFSKGIAPRVSFSVCESMIFLDFYEIIIRFSTIELPDSHFDDDVSVRL
ncbi:hypothetical protein RFI_11525 [Reticulomyxa filosa]|uniref:Uncharacterized protein n=1 Tax=Reticulomyxa filosa TaxID=46433 RepID=X6NHX2_RETFI|nr:hypothetical protein RFI_11525 [Reticulomyxa filosa]|eukprot:ETO25611.1 hypothetical protein RFI_11525 [Reticulomyxa filosa]